MATSAFGKNKGELVPLGGSHMDVQALKSLTLSTIQLRDGVFAPATTGAEAGNLLRGQRLIAAKYPRSRDVQHVGVFLETIRKPVERR